MAHIPLPTYEQLREKVQELEKEALGRKQADEVLRKSEERYRMIFNYSPLGIVHFDSSGLVVDCNECFLEIVGAAKEKLLGSNMTESMRDERMRSAAVAALSGKPSYFEGDYRSVTGDKVTPVRAMFSRITTEEGRFLGVVGLFEDITQRKKSEEVQRESQEYLGKIVNSIGDPIFVKDRQHRLILVNDAECVLAGRERKDLIGRTGYDFFPREQVDVFREKDEVVFETGKENENEEEITDAQGRTRTVVTKKTLYTDKAGNKFIVGVIRDITERRQAEEALRQRLNFQQMLIDRIPSPIFYKDIEGRYLGCNSSFESYIGMYKADIIGKTVHEVFSGDLADIYCRADLALFEEPGTQQYETSVRYADGTLHDVFFTKGTFTNPEGKVAGLVGIIFDITERKRDQRELSRYRDHLEDLVRERTAELAKANERLTLEIKERGRAEEALKMFAYSVAHDLKSPTIGIHGLTKRLHKLYGHVLDEKGLSYCDQILKASEHIAALVEQVNIFIVTKESVPLFEHTCIKDLLRMLKVEFSAQLGIRRIEWIEPESEVDIKADRLSLLRVFRNLVDNALKYGGERLSKIWIGHQDTQDFHIFSVADDGKGLKGVDSEKIFRMFHRESTSRGIEGTGLGLTIVKEIAEKHAGSVWVKAGAKKGTTFYISISKHL